MSRKIDALVAEKVMGWEVVSWRDRWAHVPMSYAMVIANPDDTLWQRTRPNVADKQWNPSTDIAAAWAVVDKMYDDGYAMELYSEPPAKPSVRFFHYIMGEADQQDGVYGDTTPLAICLAALKAVGVNVDAEEEK